MHNCNDWFRRLDMWWAGWGNWADAILCLCCPRFVLFLVIDIVIAHAIVLIPVVATIPVSVIVLAIVFVHVIVLVLNIVIVHVIVLVLVILSPSLSILASLQAQLELPNPQQSRRSNHRVIANFVTITWRHRQCVKSYDKTLLLVLYEWPILFYRPHLR